MNLIKICLLLLLLNNPVIAVSPWLENFNHPLRQQQIDLRWHADGGEFVINFEDRLLNELGIQVIDLPTQTKTIDSQPHAVFQINDTTSLEVQAPFGILESITAGQLHVKGQFKWQIQNATMTFNDLIIRATSKGKGAGEIVSAEIIDQQGNALFLLDHIHTELDIKQQQLRMLRMDVRITSWLANKINMPQIAHWVVAEAHMYNHLVIPPEYAMVRGTPTCPKDRPLWPSPTADADVALIDMSWVYRRRIDDDLVVLTPNARLKNVGEADVVWQGKFTGPVPPYNNEQHPFLNWAMYREIDNRFEQVAISDIKHAFFAQNQNCTYNCGNNFILYKGCEDTYTVSNNDGGSYLGPREELEAFTGLWEQQCSFFDPDCNNTQNNTSNSTDENRLVVNESQFSDPALSYYFSSWYLVREDVNIFNGMGWMSYEFSQNQQNLTWNMHSPSSFQNGPASDAYLPPNTTANDLMSASHRTLQVGEGHLTVAVKVIDLGGGNFRYNYMIENHDYDPQVEQIIVPLDDDASYTDFVWSDKDLILSNNWSTTRQDNLLSLTQTNDNLIDWGMLFSFSFTSDRPPELGLIRLVGHENNQNQFSVMSLRPQLDDLIFENGFEQVTVD
ncbi:hypothetical protein [Marinicella rhabdoformis]|uniref:hypothetical protein n=1 Tax=Marinicella rhabdoformis TaxID=2580566 RepID=UPI0012AEB4C5|nr:hypothetical protein [Marinicella rhabdoformis]